MVEAPPSASALPPPSPPPSTAASPTAWAAFGTGARDTAVALGFGAAWYTWRCPVENVKMAAATWASREAVISGSVKPLSGSGFAKLRQVVAVDGWAPLWRGYASTVAVVCLRPAIALGLHGGISTAGHSGLGAVLSNAGSDMASADFAALIGIWSAVLAGAAAPLFTLPLELLRQRCSHAVPTALQHTPFAPGENPACSLHYPSSTRAFLDAVRALGPSQLWSGLSSCAVYSGAYYGVYLGYFAMLQRASLFRDDYGPIGWIAAFYVAVASHCFAFTASMPFQRRWQVALSVCTPLCAPNPARKMFCAAPAEGWYRYWRASVLNRWAERGAVLAFFDRTRPVSLGGPPSPELPGDTEPKRVFVPA